MKKLFVVLVSALLISCGSGGSGGSSAPDREQVRENAVALGVSSFALGVPKFPLADYKNVSTAVRHIATNELYTFPEIPNPAQVRDTIREFADSGYLVTHQIHILNGPAMRRCTDRWINSVMGKEICDSQFDDLVLNNSTMRDALLNLFVEVVDHANQIQASGASVLISIELEDNHSPGINGSYGSMIGLLHQAGWHDNTKIVRNSVNGYVGDIPGIRSEIHPQSFQDLSRLRPGDIANTDGKSFSFSSESNPSYLFSEEEIRQMVDYSQKRGIIFYVWSDRLQGLIQIGPNSAMSHDGSYSNRNYVLRNPIEFIAILLGITKEEVGS